MISALQKADYRCYADGSYATCSKGDVDIHVLMGTTHPLPVLSILSTGRPAQTYPDVKAKVLPVLLLAHVDEAQLIDAWYTARDGRDGNTVIGKWRVELSVENGEEPQTDLTITSTACGPECHPE